MTVSEILALLAQNGIRLQVEDNLLRYHAPKGALTEELRKLLAENKNSLISYLNKTAAAPENSERVAVIGMACRFPGAPDAKSFWENLINGVESIRRFTDEELDALGVPPEVYNAPNFVKAAPVIDAIDMFDAAFFGYSPKEAQIMDPQQRIFLECAWSALEDAGYNPGDYRGRIGVFGGAGTNYYGGNCAAKAGNYSVAESYQLELGNEKDYLATRVAYKLDLKGPALTIQTACSTSLVATHIACQNLLTHQCDMALSGGVSINVRMKGGYFFQEGLIPSPDGHCRAFDAKAQGTVGGQGAGIVVLKRLSDAMADGDKIYAVIRGSAINNDGAAKVGFTAPGIAGQCEVIRAAQVAAGAAAEDIGYVEAHGTGTPLGDPIEIKALTKAFRQTTSKSGYCPIGSLKTNIGHLDAAAGVAGLIKTVLMLEHGAIPPSLHFEQPNPNLELASSPFFVNTQLSKWADHGSPRLAGISSFGLGGTNAHVIVGEAPPREASDPAGERQLLLFSARTKDALKCMIANMAGHLEQNPQLNLADIAYTLQIGRKPFAHRATLVCSGAADASTALRSGNPARVVSSFCEAGHRDVIFMFSGQGSQYPGMAQDLYNSEPVFRKHIDDCAEILQREFAIDVRALLYPEQNKLEQAEEILKQTGATQIALFVTEYALARLWMSWGIRPQALVGHSIGEYVAACLAEVFSLDEALKLVAARGRLMQAMPPGCMLAVFLPEDQLAPFMNSDLSLSVINSPGLCVVGGEAGAIESLESTLGQKQIMSRRLHTSHAFHSKMMDPVLQPFIEQVRQVELKPPKIPFVSNLTGTWITQEEATDPEYWANHLRNTVRFADCLQEIFKEPQRVLLEVGPGQTLSLLANQHPAKAESHAILSSTRLPKQRQSDSHFIYETLGGLWRAGVTVDWAGFYACAKRQRISLPTYPFERKRHWIEAEHLTSIPAADAAHGRQPAPGDSDGKKTQETENKKSDNLTKQDHLSRSKVEQTLTDIWRDILGHSEISPHDNFFELGGHSLVAIRLFAKIENIFGKRLPMATLVSSPTVRQLADLLVQDDFAPSWSSLVKIRDTGTKPPFFAIHSEGGNVLEYVKLADYLDHDRPFYGIQAQGLDGTNIVARSIHEMASHYIADIKTIQPQGPYFIGGFCLGGLVAFEMARQMEMMGDRVQFLAMISTYAPAHLNREIPNLSIIRRSYFSALERLELEIDNLSALNAKEKLAYIGDRMRRLELIGTVIYEDLADLLTRLLNKKPYNHSRRYILEATRNAQAMAFYDFKPVPVKTAITLYRTSKQPRSLIFDPTLGWANMSESGIRDLEIRAFHKNILKDPSVKELAKKIQEGLDEAQGSMDISISDKHR